MPAPSIASPNVGNLQVGKGIVSFMKEGTNAFRDLGNINSMTITPDMTTLDHFSSREGVRKKDLSIIIEKQATVQIAMEEVTAQNLELMLLGDIDYAAVGGPEVEIFSQNAINGWLRFVGTNEIGPKITVDLYNVSFKPSGELQLISDEFNVMEATGDVLVAASGPNLGKFGVAKFTNVAAAAAATFVGIAPATGAAAGGTAVTITGTGFGLATNVTFDGADATDILIVSDTTITCKTPAGTVGTADVVVEQLAGDATGAAAFTYS